MLTRIRLHNFKGWASADLPLSKINVFFGTNSSGKSSLLQSLLLLKQTVSHYDRNRPLHFGDREKDFVELGSFENIIHGHDKNAELKLGLQWVPDKPIIIGPQKEVRLLGYEGGFRFIDEQLILQSLTFTGDEISFAIRLSEEGNYSAILKTDSPKEETRALKDGPSGCHGLPHETTRLFQGELFPLEFSNEFETLFKKVRYLGPLRDNPKRVYDWSGSKPSSVGLRGEYAVQALLAGLKTSPGKVKKTKSGPKFKLHEETRKWMKELGVADDLQIVPIDKDQRLFEVKLRVKNALHDASIVDVGVGVSQVLPVIVHLFDSPPGSILLFEQPEIHLHPSVQACLADLFLSAAEMMGHQLLIESHSEHFLVRMQRRIAEAEKLLARPEHVKIFLCRTSETGSFAKELRLDEFGKIDNWPPDFFGDTLSDREAIVRAMIQKK